MLLVGLFRPDGVSGVPKGRLSGKKCSWLQRIRTKSSRSSSKLVASWSCAIFRDICCMHTKNQQTLLEKKKDNKHTKYVGNFLVVHLEKLFCIDKKLENVKLVIPSGLSLQTIMISRLNYLCHYTFPFLTFYRHCLCQCKLSSKVKLIFRN